MDAHRPGDGEQNKRNDKLLCRFLAEVGLDQNIERNDGVQHQIAVQNDHIPGQKRIGKGEDSDDGDNVPEPVGSAQVGQNKHQGHDDRRCGQQLPQNDNFLNRIEVIDVRRYHEKHGGGGDADQIGKVADIKAPGDLVFHVRYDQPRIQLFRVEGDPHTDDGQQESAPEVVRRRPDKNHSNRSFKKYPGFHAVLNIAMRKRSNKTWVPYSNLPSI